VSKTKPGLVLDPAGGQLHLYKVQKFLKATIPDCLVRHMLPYLHEVRSRKIPAIQNHLPIKGHPHLWMVNLAAVSNRTLSCRRTKDPNQYFPCQDWKEEKKGGYENGQKSQTPNEVQLKSLFTGCRIGVSRSQIRFVIAL
jgi:hypothetical protein